ncbi:MAG: hypothetical protein ABIE55_02370 [Candidatus Aenigmatarchaeota archaeon]
MYMIGKKICPLCGVKGNTWKKDRNVFVCPSCSSFFNDFGIVLEPEIRKESMFS